VDWGDDQRANRFAIQALRAQPPGLAARRGQRRRVFSAALEQFDQLLDAAAAAGAAAAPIPLFYALSQAGRALAAARLPANLWRPTSHGLGAGNPVATIGSTPLTPDASTTGSFQLFCLSIGSPVLTAPIELSAAWAATGRFQTVKGLGADYPPARAFNPFDPEFTAIFEGDLATDLPRDKAQAEAVLANRLSAYPGARDGLSLSSNWPNTAYAYPRVEVSWRTPHNKLRSLKDVAPAEYPTKNAQHFLLPGLGAKEETLHPLAAIYASLLGLSSLARYHPAEWRQALDRDATPTAMAIQGAITLSLELLPYAIRAFLYA
jgi:hypothetical protein